MGPRCFPSILNFVSNVRQLLAADEYSRRHFSDDFFSWVFKGNSDHKNLSLGFLTKYDSTQSAHLQRLARILKFCM